MRTRRLCKAPFVYIYRRLRIEDGRRISSEWKSKIGRAAALDGFQYHAYPVPFAWHSARIRIQEELSIG